MERISPVIALSHSLVFLEQIIQQTSRRAQSGRKDTKKGRHF